MEGGQQAQLARLLSNSIKSERMKDDLNWGGGDGGGGGGLHACLSLNVPMCCLIPEHVRPREGNI